MSGDAVSDHATAAKRFRRALRACYGKQADEWDALSPQPTPVPDRYAIGFLASTLLRQLDGEVCALPVGDEHTGDAG